MLLLVSLYFNADPANVLPVYQQVAWLITVRIFLLPPVGTQHNKRTAKSPKTWCYPPDLCRAPLLITGELQGPPPVKHGQVQAFVLGVFFVDKFWHCWRAMQRLQGELADAFRKQWIAETSLKASTHQCNYLKKENSHLQEDLDKARAKVCELSAQLELESQNSLELRVRNQELRGLVALLPLHLAAPGVDHTTTALYGKQREQRAQEETREKQPLSLLLQTQAAAQARRGESNTTDASWRKQLGQRIRALELDLERARSMQEESALQLACAQAEIQSSEKRNLVGLEIRRCLTKALKKANERLAEAGAESPQEQRRRLLSREAKSLSQTRGQSGNPSGSGKQPQV
ncbi:uncharacterized protein M6G45_013494 [Spheniscus humboldti]